MPAVADEPTDQPTDRPTVSVILTTHRRPHLVGRAIQSVLDQTYDDFELLVIDDGSGDDTPSVVAAFGDPRLHLEVLPTNVGLPEARNVGLRLARGDYIGFLDDDDEWLPRKLELQVSALASAPPQVGAAWCHQMWEFPDGSTRTRRIVLTGDVYRTLQYTDIVFMQPLLVRRSAADAVGPFDREIRFHEDYSWTLRLARRFEFVTVDEVLVLMHYVEGSMSREPVARRIAGVRWLLDFHEGLRDPGPRARWLTRYARDLHTDGQRAEAARQFAAAIRLRPWSPRVWAVAAVTLIGGSGLSQRLARTRNLVHRRVRAVRHRSSDR